MLHFLIIMGVTGVLVSLRALINRLMYKRRQKREKAIFEPKPFTKEESFIHDTLLQLDYFKNLSREGKERFIKRTHKVLRRLQFSTAGNIEANSARRVLIVASITQITFGLDDYDIDSIEHVKIFENNIYNPKTKVQFKGLTFMNGNMYISWEHFVKGIEVKDDGIHLGLHETAHGLLILLRSASDQSFEELLQRWYTSARHEIQSREGEKKFLRAYAATNVEEFFSVCIENFFERPAEFREKLPEVYRELSIFLNQDPSNTHDYKIVGATTGPEPIDANTERLYLHKNRWDHSHTFFILFSYFSLVAILIMKRLLMETMFNIILFSIPCMFVTYYAFKRFYLDSKKMTQRQYLLFSTTSISPVVLLLVLSLNVLIPVTGKYKMQYKPQGSYRQMAFAWGQNDFALLDNTKTIYLLKGNNTVPIDLRVFKEDEYEGKTIEYTYHYGITGLKVFDSVEVKYE